MLGKAVCDGTRISSPAFNPMASWTSSIAAVHDDESTQWLVPVCAASSASNASHSFVRIYWPDSSARTAAALTSSFRKTLESGIFFIVDSGELDRAGFLRGLQRGLENAHGFVAGPTVGMMRLARLDRFQEAPQFRVQRLLRRKLQLLRKSLGRLHIRAVDRVQVGEGLDLVLRD